MTFRPDISELSTGSVTSLAPYITIKPQPSGNYAYHVDLSKALKDRTATMSGSCLDETLSPQVAQDIAFWALKKTLHAIQRAINVRPRQ